MSAALPTQPISPEPLTSPLRPAPPPDREPAPPPDRKPAPPPDREPARISPWVYRLPLVVWAVVLQLVLYSNSGYSWHFFADAATLLDGHSLGQPGGLHIYANYPQLQFGPLALVATVALSPVTDTGGWMIASWLMTLAGLAVLWLLEHLARVSRRDATVESWPMVTTMLVGGGSFVLSWELLAVHFGHLDDVIALVLLLAAGVATTHRSPVLAGICVGLATDAKPWALACAALLFVLPGWARWRAIIAAVVVIVGAWLPFVLADPRTMHAATFAIPNVAASGLHALGVNSAMTPSWDRIAQVGIGCLLGGVAVVRRRWPAVLALGIGARIALDPSVYTYYTAGLALGLLWWDLVAYRRPRPVLSTVCFVGLTLALVLIKDAVVLGELRLWTVLVVAAAMLVAPTALSPGPTRARPTRGSGFREPVPVGR